MTGLSAQQRVDDICAISGLSESIVRRVMGAERESIIRSLKRGERATLLGRVVIRPSLETTFQKRTVLDANNKKVSIVDLDETGQPKLRNFIKLKATVAPSLASKLEEEANFEVDESEDEQGNIEIRVAQIEELM